uniref:Vomeronasal type-1 receptor n=1 Tax=Prolemur simus TaxID=1328070 RepID=A0A8C9AUZ3_PROSS
MFSAPQMIIAENVLNDSVASKDMEIGIIFLSQTTIGILGNVSLLYHYLFFSHTEGRSRFRDLILKHLIIANSLVILTTGVPQTLTAFRLKHLFNDFGCELLLYVQRVGRGMSMGTTCFLSVFQTITISPMNSMWKNLKVKVPKYIGCSILFCWILYILVNFIFPAYLFVKWSSKNITKKRDFGSCSILDHDKILDSLYVALLVFPEVLFSVLIILSSSSMVFILYRHKQQVQHIATQRILILVSTFVSFHTLSSIFHACIAQFYNTSWWLVNTAALISVCFPTVSPFVLMSRDSAVSRFCFLCMRSRKSPNLLRNM